MSFAHKNRRFRPPLAAAWLITLSLAGCANPGPPKPPSLHLPKLATELTAERVGRHVGIAFTVSADTTDGGTLKGPITAILCRELPLTATNSTQNPPFCRTVVQRFAVVPGPAHVQDDLPAALTAGAAELLAYRVELLNSRGRSAGLSAPVYAAAGGAPAPVGAISITPRRNAALITWKAAADTTPMQVERTLLATAAGPVKAPATKSKRSGQPPALFSSTKKEPPRQVTLALGAAETADPGGLLDPTLHDGDTATYVAQRVRKVEFTAPAAWVYGKKGVLEETKPTPETLEVRGEASAPVTFTFHDTLPPSVPTGLAAVPGGGFSEPASIDLSWEPNPEQDVVGYNVYRADAGYAPVWKLLNSEIAPGSAYRDLTAQPGKTYLYRVTAIDQRHNESGPSASLQEQLHP